MTIRVFNSKLLIFLIIHNINQIFNIIYQYTPLHVCEFKQNNLLLQQQIKQREITKIPTYFEIQKRWKAEMKPKKVLGIKKKIKKKIYIIFIDKECFGSPHNTNQFLLQKHKSIETDNEKEVQPPGSMLSYLLNEKKNDHQMNNPNKFELIKETSELSQIPNNYYSN